MYTPLVNFIKIKRLQLSSPTTPCLSLLSLLLTSLNYLLLPLPLSVGRPSILVFPFPSPSLLVYLRHNYIYSILFLTSLSFKLFRSFPFPPLSLPFLYQFNPPSLHLLYHFDPPHYLFSIVLNPPLTFFYSLSPPYYYYY